MTAIINSNFSKNKMREKAGNDVLLSVIVNNLACDKKIDLIKKVLLWGEPSPQIHLPALKDRLNFINQVIETSKASGDDMNEQQAQRVNLLETIIATMSPPISWSDIFYSSNSSVANLNQKECWVIEKIKDVQSDWGEALIDAMPEPVPVISENNLLLFDKIVQLGIYGIIKSLLAKKFFHPNDRVSIKPSATPSFSRPIWYAAMSSSTLELMLSSGADLTQVKVYESGEKISFIKEWGDVGFMAKKSSIGSSFVSAINNREFRAKQAARLVKVLKKFWPDSISEEVNKIWYKDLPAWMPDAAPAAIELLSKRGFKNGIRVVHDDQVLSLSMLALRRYAPAAALSLIESGVKLHSPLNVNNFMMVFNALPLLTSAGLEARNNTKDLRALEVLWERYYPRDWQECDNKGRNLLGQLFSSSNFSQLIPTSINQEKVKFDKSLSTRDQTLQLWLAREMIKNGVDMFAPDEAGVIPAAQAIIWAARGEEHWYNSRQVDIFSNWLVDGLKVKTTNVPSADSFDSYQPWAGLKNCSAKNLEKFWVSLAGAMGTHFYRAMVKGSPNELHISSVSILKSYVRVLKKLFDTIPPPESFWQETKINDLIQDMSVFEGEERLKFISATWLEKKLTAITNKNVNLLPRGRMASKI